MGTCWLAGTSFGLQPKDPNVRVFMFHVRCPVGLAWGAWIQPLSKRITSLDHTVPGIVENDAVTNTTSSHTNTCATWCNHLSSRMLDNPPIVPLQCIRATGILWKGMGLILSCQGHVENLQCPPDHWVHVKLVARDIIGDRKRRNQKQQQ